VATFLQFYSEKIFSQEEVNKIAYEVEQYFHQNPSGVDNTASCFGGLIYYRKELEFIKNIIRLPFLFPQKIESHLFLIDSGKPKETTKEMVIQVNQLYQRKTKMVETVLNQIEKITKKIVISLKENDEKTFKKAIFENQKCLEKLAVVSTKAKKILFQLKPFGVGKITGAGGRKEGAGFLLFYAENPDQLKNFCQSKKISYFIFRQSSSGLTPR